MKNLSLIHVLIKWYFVLIQIKFNFIPTFIEKKKHSSQKCHKKL